ncbi:hypothetical protein K493DRAFT_313252 [Basidiobolus meristosporus CBS 931.73]|uniref:Uncharacterized protein n=1 Tax=Basidiobolus meristosporus CBS 931.73 TaxID=1314790 RepID=A0A1Y1YMX5_9FUNG|nr:hypothetical protein K493DRAFT_313252 [Basidiobolus meristosporus CBS 931.73]|eukprot:ORX99377.1 hypothetical protein K493DRAFT_313252 [Basidiobolus meristosporus CBS 931.73]
MSLIKSVAFKLSFAMPSRVAMTAGARKYTVQNQAVQVHQRDWMDAEESHSYAQEAMRSVNEETVSALGELKIHKIGNYESEQEHSRKPWKAIRRDWLSTSEDQGYAQEAMRSVLQDTIYNPVGLNVHSIASSIQFERRQSDGNVSRQPLKADWLDAEEGHHASEAIRFFESDTVNSLSESPIHTTAQKLI